MTYSFRQILESHTVANLKKEISKTNIKGYSKKRRNEIIELMMEYEHYFKHMKIYVKPTRKKPTRKKTTRKKPKRKKPTRKKKDEIFLLKSLVEGSFDNDEQTAELKKVDEPEYIKITKGKTTKPEFKKATIMNVRKKITTKKQTTKKQTTKRKKQELFYPLSAKNEKLLNDIKDGLTKKELYPPIQFKTFEIKQSNAVFGISRRITDRSAKGKYEFEYDADGNKKRMYKVYPTISLSEYTNRYLSFMVEKKRDVDWFKKWVKKKCNEHNNKYGRCLLDGIDMFGMIYPKLRNFKDSKGYNGSILLDYGASILLINSINMNKDLKDKDFKLDYDYRPIGSMFFDEGMRLRSGFRNDDKLYIEDQYLLRKILNMSMEAYEEFRATRYDDYVLMVNHFRANESRSYKIIYRDTYKPYYEKPFGATLTRLKKLQNELNKPKYKNDKRFDRQRKEVNEQLKGKLIIPKKKQTTQPKIDISIGDFEYKPQKAVIQKVGDDKQIQITKGMITIPEFKKATILNVKPNDNIYDEKTVKWIYDNYAGLKSRREIQQFKKMIGDKPYAKDLLNAISGKSFLDFYPTPISCLDSDIVKRVIRYADVILEPSAGTGAMMYKAYKDNPDVKIKAVELSLDLEPFLKYHYPNANIVQGNFLNINNYDNYKDVDTVLLNPPFTKGGDKRFYLDFLFKIGDLLNNTKTGRMPEVIFICPRDGLGTMKDRVEIQKGNTIDPQKVFNLISFKKLKELCKMLNIDTRGLTQQNYKQFKEEGEYEHEAYTELDNLLPFQIQLIDNCEFRTTGTRIEVYSLIYNRTERPVEEPDIYEPEPEPEPEQNVILDIYNSIMNIDNDSKLNDKQKKNMRLLVNYINTHNREYLSSDNVLYDIKDVINRYDKISDNKVKDELTKNFSQITNTMIDDGRFFIYDNKLNFKIKKLTRDNEIIDMLNLNKNINDDYFKAFIFYIKTEKPAGLGKYTLQLNNYFNRFDKYGANMTKKEKNYIWFKFILRAKGFVYGETSNKYKVFIDRVEGYKPTTNKKITMNSLKNIPKDDILDIGEMLVSQPRYYFMDYVNKVLNYNPKFRDEMKTNEILKNKVVSKIWGWYVPLWNWVIDQSELTDHLEPYDIKRYYENWEYRIVNNYIAGGRLDKDDISFIKNMYVRVVSNGEYEEAYNKIKKKVMDMKDKEYTHSDMNKFYILYIRTIGSNYMELSKMKVYCDYADEKVLNKNDRNTLLLVIEPLLNLFFKLNETLTDIYIDKYNKKNKNTKQKTKDDECKKILETYNINNIKDFRKFTLKYHPDKTLNLPKKEREEKEQIFKTVSGCVDILIKKRGGMIDFNKNDDIMLEKLCSLSMKRLRQICRRMNVYFNNSYTKEQLLRGILGIN